MASAHVTIDTRELERVQARVDDLAHLDRPGLLDAIGAEVVSQTQRRIADEKTAPDGTPWEPWSERYARTRHGGQSLLQGEGDLLESIQHVVAGDEVLVGSPLVYAAIHQFSGDEVDIPIPARPYLGLSPENEDALLAIVEDHIREVLRA